MNERDPVLVIGIDFSRSASYDINQGSLVGGTTAPSEDLLTTDRINGRRVGGIGVTSSHGCD